MSDHPLLRLGFRLFFLGAIVFSIGIMALWFAVYAFGLHAPAAPISAVEWHAHEMIYGYALAVIAGFLLTAVRTWTGQETLSGYPLLVLWALWCGARLCFSAGADLRIAALLDGSFLIVLAYAVITPIVRVKQWRQMGVLAKLVLMGAGNGLFYLGHYGLVEHGKRWGVYLGFYLVIGLILTMSRRLIPFFVEGGVGYAVALRNSRLLDIASLALFLPFFALDTFTSYRHIAALFAIALFVVHALRITGWYTPGIWRKPLLWSLYLAYASIIVAFAFYAAGAFGLIAPQLAVHLFAVGGVGVVTLSMMARVSLGHTGRDVHNPPRIIVSVLAFAALALLARAVLPIFLAAYYVPLIMLSQLLWIASFGALLSMLGPMLVRRRIDE